MNEPDADGRKLSTTFEQAMDGVGLDLGPLVADAAARGRSIRRRRRLTVAGTVTAVVALAIGGTVALRTDGGSTTAVAVAAASPTVSPTPSQRFPQPLQRPDDGPEQLLPGTGPHTGEVAMTGHAALAALAKALPSAGRTSDYAGHSALLRPTKNADPEGVLVLADMLYDDGSGPASVRLRVEGNLGAHLRADSNPSYDDLFSCAKLNKGGQYRYCSDSVLPDGTRLLLIERATGDVLEREVTLLRPDLARVSVVAANTAEVAGQAKVQVVREGLPLSLDQLKAAAMATSLQEWITPEEARQAEQTIRPFHDNSPERDLPSGSATPKPGSAG
ncbi:hypothetical protein ACIRYZ_34855 [Kitasatospora sp. NPDC101155]|uniref:hypothetical protein n=1 Tax=Kitasatospora sp. NPDC101155 TaxID=3364097 RepID=UPI0038092ED5